MPTDTAPLPTRNPMHGFFRPIEVAGESAETAWHIASRLIADATGADDQFSREGIRDFLDSRLGRHFADTVLDRIAAQGLTEGASLRTAIQEAIARWQGWRISRTDQREHGIPAGLPLLTGWVQFHTIQAEIEWTRAADANA